LQEDREGKRVPQKFRREFFACIGWQFYRVLRLSFFIFLLTADLGYTAIAQQDIRPAAAAIALLRATFNGSDAGQGWDAHPSARYARLKTIGSNGFIQIRSTRDRSQLFQKSLPISEAAGRKVMVRFRLRTAGVSRSRTPAGSILAALRIRTPTSEEFIRCPLTTDPLPWRTNGFTAVIPARATACDFLIGLERGGGPVEFDDIEISVLTPSPNSPRPMARTAAPRLRGAMVATFATADDLRALAAWGANHVRWQFTWGGFPQSPADTSSLAAYRTWLRGALTHARSLMPLCDSLGLRILLDLHTLPGGARYEAGNLAEHRIFSSPEVQAEFVSIWEEIVTTFRAEPALWGYDLANEPVEGGLPVGTLHWQALVEKTAAAIRALDPVHTIVVEGAPSGGVPALPGLYPLQGAGSVVYSFHIYDPILFTHQGVVTPDTTIRYPGIIGGRYWDKDSLRAWMQPVRDWQARYDVPVYVGEFSALRWAPDSSAYRYIRDCIELFEEWGWPWAYHAWREYDGWSAEHGPDRHNHQRSAAPTDRELLLREAFRRNVH